MFNPKLPNFTEAELRIMQILWRSGSATVREVAVELSKETELAYTTVLSTLQTMEQKGFVDHETRGRAYAYRPLVELDDAQDTAIEYVLNRFFSGSAESLVLKLMEQNEVTPETIERLRELLEQGEGED